MFSNRPEGRFRWTRKSILRNLQTYRYEPIQPYVFREFVRAFRPKYFLDIGANIGYYSLLIAAEESCEKIFAYEPMPGTYKELKKNIRRNGMDGLIICHQLAVSCTEGHSTMDVVGEISGSNALTSTALHNTQILRRQAISTTTIDQMHDLSNSSIAMKIDVEGHEYQVIQGAVKLLENNPTILQIEILDRITKSNDVLRQLEELGFRKIFSAGPDKYFTNDEELASSAIPVMEKALQSFIQDFKRPLYIKPRFFPGLGIELSPQFLKNVPSIFRPRFRRKMNR